jgi:integrase/recombinase XerD
MLEVTRLHPVGDDSPEHPEQIIEQWGSWMTFSKNLSTNTQRLYLRTVAKAWSDLPDLPQASEEVLERWVQSKAGSPGTVANRITALASFFRFLVKTKRRSDNPTSEMDRPKIHKRLPKPVENLEATLDKLDDVDRLARVWGTADRRIGETRDMAVFLAYTGLRIHEAVKCDWPVPCPEEAMVIGKGDKEALMFIPDKAREAWNRLEGRWPIGARATQRRFEKAGIHPHQCRHWRATSLVRAGVEIGTVSKIMRHSSVNTTMGYAAYAREQMIDALGKVG